MWLLILIVIIVVIVIIVSSSSKPNMGNRKYGLAEFNKGYSSSSVKTYGKNTSVNQHMISAPNPEVETDDEMFNFIQYHSINEVDTWYNLLKKDYKFPSHIVAAIQSKHHGTFRNPFNQNIKSNSENKQIADLNFVAIDFETANEKRNSACALGWARVENGVIVDSGEFYFKPKEFRVSPFNERIHGLSASFLNNKPEIFAIWK